MLELTVAFYRNPRVQPLLEGQVRPRDVRLEFVLGHPADLFLRALRDDEFDAFEMSIVDFMKARELSDGKRWHWRGLPVFLSKAFLWLDTWVNENAGVREVSDLAGKSFGVPDYTMAAAVWMRIVFQRLFGLKPQDLVWYNGRPLEASHGATLNLHTATPPGIRLNWLKSGQSLQEMLEAGQVHAAFGDSNRVRIGGDGHIGRLFPDGGRQIVREFHARTGVIPANHTVVVKESVLAEHPWLAGALFEAFERSKQVACGRARELQAAYLLFPGDDFARQAATYGEDPFPLGLERNRAMLDLLVEGLMEEGWLKRRPRLEELFWQDG